MVTITGPYTCAAIATLWLWGIFPEWDNVLSLTKETEKKDRSWPPCPALSLTHTHIQSLSQKPCWTQRGTPDHKPHRMMNEWKTQITRVLQTALQTPQQLNIYCGLLSGLVYMTKVCMWSLPPSFHFHFEGKGGFLWSASCLPCWKRTQESQLFAQTRSHIGRVFGLRWFVLRIKSAGFNSFQIC